MVDTVIIGSGNLAEALATALFRAGHPPAQIFARNAKAAKEIADKCGSTATDDPGKVKPAGLYIIAVSDKAIGAVSESLDFGDAVVAHTAGSVPIDALSANIRHRGVFYPMQTFTKGRQTDFSAVPIMVEATTPKALKVLVKSADLLSENVIEVASQQRAKIHVAAVFASNFTNYMYTVGEELAGDAGMDFSVLKPLIRETAEKALAAATPRHTQTGPASRNDFQTKALHCELLVEKPNLKNIYINLSNSIWEISKKTSQR